MDKTLRFDSLFFGRKLVSLGVLFLGTVLISLLLPGVFSTVFSLLFALLFLAGFFLWKERERRMFCLFASLGIALALTVVGIHFVREEKCRALSGEKRIVSGVVTYVSEEAFDVSFVSLPECFLPVKIRVFGEKIPCVGEKVQGEFKLFSDLSSASREDGVDLGGKGDFEIQGKNGFYTALSALKNNLSSRFPKGQEGAFFRAVLFGGREEMSRENTEAFHRSASSHLLAISGLHITLLMGIFQTLFRVFPLSRNGKSLILALLAFLLFFLTGGSVSVFRAGVMSLFPLGATLCSRRSDSLTALLFSAVLLVSWEPRCLLSLSFLFSFASVFAILTAAGPLTDALANRFREKKMKKNMRFVSKILLFVLSSFTVSGIVFVFTFPLQLLVFGEVLPFAPLYALILIPLFTPVILSGLVYLVLSFLPWSLSFLKSACLLVPKGYLALVRTLSRGVPEMVSFGSLNLFAALLVLAVLGFFMAKQGRLSHLFYLYGSLVLLCGATGLVFR